MDSAAALLTAIVSRLSGVCGGRVYGAPQPNATYPYAMVTAQSEPFSADDFSGMSHNIRVQVFSRQKKPGEALAERKTAYTALHRQEDAITVTGHTLVSIEQDGVADCFIEDDGKTWQAIMEFKAVVV